MQSTTPNYYRLLLTYNILACITSRIDGLKSAYLTKKIPNKIKNIKLIA